MPDLPLPSPAAGSFATPSRPSSPATSRASWHRRASRPVTLWMIALVLVVLVHPWLPQSRWLMVHMVTLGLITTSIMVWGQHFTEALLKTRLGEETRARQVGRIWLLTGGIVVTIVGMLPGWPWLVMLGALIVSAAILWYALALGSQVRAAIAPRFAFTVKAYITASCLLPIGAALGAILAFSPPEPWQGRLLLAHQVLNVLGFVGITVTGTLLSLWPTILRTKIDLPSARRASRGLIGMAVGVVGATAGALTGATLVGTVLLAVYLGSFLWVAALLVRLAVRSARQEHRLPLPLFPILSIAAGLLWFLLTQMRMLAEWVGSADGPLASSLLAGDVQRLTVPFVAGFLLQVLLGAMTYLLPVTMRGGPRAVKAANAVMDRFAVPRVVAYNLVVALMVLAGVGTAAGDALFAGLTLGTGDTASFGSLSRVLVALLGFVVLVSFLVLTALGVRASVRAHSEDSALGMPPIGRPAPDAGTAPGGLPIGPPPAAAGTTPAAATDTDRRVDRRALTGALVGLGTVLGVNAVGSALDRAHGTVGSATTGGSAAGDVAATGETTTIAVGMSGMRFHPDELHVPAGNTLVIALSNDDEQDVHDLVLEDGTSSGRLRPGASTTLEVGVIGHDLDGWCSIVGHRAMGMTLRVVADGASGAGHDHASGGSAASTVDDLTAVTADLMQGAGEGYTVRDARLPEAVRGDQRVTLEITEAALEIAPGVMLDAMTFGGTVVGPVLRSGLGARLTVELVNHGSMGHSLDMHAGRVAPDQVMRTIAPGESLEYPITTDHAGVWLYHCSTMPMTVHLAAGMLGALIVPPAGLAAADREYVLVQSDHYLVPDGATGSDEAMHEGAHPVSPAKIAADRPDFTVFNGHASQYVGAPLTARVGERVRLWVLAAGPSRGISFHVVGGVFDTVFAEGEYLLRPDAETAGGAQALHLGAAQGGFVELVFDEPGTYTAVNHSLSDMERGARALITVT